MINSAALPGTFSAGRELKGEREWRSTKAPEQSLAVQRITLQFASGIMCFYFKTRSNFTRVILELCAFFKLTPGNLRLFRARANSRSDQINAHRRCANKGKSCVSRDPTAYTWFCLSLTVMGSLPCTRQSDTRASRSGDLPCPSKGISLSVWKGGRDFSQNRSHS